MRPLPRLAAAALVAVLAAPAAAHAAAPAATTEPPRDIGRDRATFVATVDPNGESTTVRFDYGTTTSYGVQSATRTVEGDDPVGVAIAVTGLTADTVYHVRAVATNASGSAQGADRSFRTASPAPQPRPPAVTTGGVREVTRDAATLAGSVDPNGARTRYRFELGTTTAYGRSTIVRALAPGDTAVPVAIRIGRLRPGTLYHYRLIASNAAGRTIGRDRTFRTGRGITGATLVATPRPAVWGQAVQLTGSLRGGRTRGVDVVLERQEWPFTGLFTAVGPARRTNSRGVVTFSLPVFRTVRLRVAGGGVLSRPVEVLVRPRVGLRVRRTSPRRLRFSGAIWPRVRGARVSLQRRSPSGRWSPIARRAPVDLDAGRSRYAIRVPATRRTATWRVVVTPVADGSYVRGISREVRVRGTASERR